MSGAWPRPLDGRAPTGPVVPEPVLVATPEPATRLARRGRALPSDAGLHITVLLHDQIADDELRAHTRAHGLRVPPVGDCYRFTPPRCGWVVGFGAIPTPDIPAGIDALVTALHAAAPPPRH